MRLFKTIACLGALAFLMAACSAAMPSEEPAETPSLAVGSPEEALEILRGFISSEDIFIEEESDKVLGLRYRDSPNFVLQYDSLLEDDRGQFYQFHEYEYVVDDPETGEGHTATYNWYRVYAADGGVTAMFDAVAP